MWLVETGVMIKSFDAHFARINNIRPLICSQWNCIITSSMDRTMKVWNLNNIFEKVHLIDRLETQIDSISLNDSAGIAVTATRGCIGIWEILTGKLQARLADSAYGAIVSHASVIKDGEFIIAVESGYVIYWNVGERSVLFKEKQDNILQLVVFENGEKCLVVSRLLPDCTALGLVRTIPTGQMLYEFSFTFKQYKNIVLTSDYKFFVCYGSEKGKDTLFYYGTEDGELHQKFQAKYPNFKEPSMIVAMPNKSTEIALIDPDKGVIMNSSTKKLDRIIPKWGGKEIMYKYTQTGCLYNH